MAVREADDLTGPGVGAMKDDPRWRRGVWIDFVGAAALLALLGALVGLMTSCT